jgi:phosphate uptake regulator
MGFLDLFREEQPPLVGRAFDDICTMLKVGSEMFAAATAYLLDNEILDVDLSKLDDKINDREHDLRRVVLEHLTIDPNRELVFSLKMLSIVHEAERIGDIAKSLAKVGHLAKKPRMGAIVEPLRQVRDQVQQMFEQTQRGFIQSNEEVARDLMRTHETMKETVTQLINETADRGDLSPNEAVVYVLAARLMSRVSSHLANIASTVVSPFDRIRSAPTWGHQEQVPSR